MSTPFKVIIVGGGPVGLTAAHALSHAGIDFVVLESRDSVVLDQGASLVLGPPSLRVMHQLGLLDQLMAIGGELNISQSFTHQGYEFRHYNPFQIIQKNHGTVPVCFHRAHLVETLYNELPEQAKQRYLVNQKVIDIESLESHGTESDVKNDTVRVTCADGTTYEGSMVLGADGTHSITRQLMRRLALAANPAQPWDAEKPFPATYRCTWCSFPRGGEKIGIMTETQNQDMSVMYLTGRERGWVFLYERLPEPTTERTKYTTEDIEAVAARFAEYSVTETRRVKDVFAERFNAGMANLEEGILQHWNWDRIVLTGDACHKYTPNAGLGLNDGIQDVVVLCNGLHQALQRADGPLSTATLGRVFEAYHTERAEQVQADAKQSAQVTRLHAWANTLYYLISRYILSWNVIEGAFLNYHVSKKIKKAAVLTYIRASEPFKGAVQWDHPMEMQ
ncbi:FAD-dependent oxidoreductase [Aspergillus ibericus CBS 121593]|uniref:FAD binding domain-containing protein n=1 Tax=Aspergillus ibericus CBS 121593 TaxID=1448316 RepID=A0A395H5F7_9EURO|nr:FAD binding domain-containing protein [Aspergillus ibericus CBS 121593]RAL03112.1 FAD binding domain-containing protein [Aspergillus ibericus CBS 121593]